jgi:hypothetical protein
MSVALGSDAALQPALEYEGEIYTAPLNGQHLDALPKHLAKDFHQKAMSGEDISKFNFGFINDKGEFLSREDALKYAIDVGLLHPNNAKYATLTSGMLIEMLNVGKLAKRDSPPK